MAKNIYGEMFEQLPIPARLEPENIAKMLDEHMAANSKRSAITVSSSDNINKEKAPRKTRSAAYRAICSAAACAVLVLGLVRYMGVDQPDITAETPVPGSYASDYDEIHKTFQKYYVDDTDKETLDSAIAEIEHSYNENRNESETDQVTDDPVVTTTDTSETENPVSVDQPPVADIPDDNQPIEEEPDDNVIIEEDDVILPDMSNFGAEDGIVIDGDRIFIRDGNEIRVISSVGGDVRYTDTVEMFAQANETKSLIDYYVVGNRLAAVYSVETAEPVTVVEAPEEIQGDSVLDEIMGNAYAETTQNVIKHSTEVCIFEIVDGIAVQVYSASQCGSFIEAKQVGDDVYIVTNYNDYRLSPIVGVNDLDSYVPTYTVNGLKSYIEPSDILIPSRVSTTDYTVILGISAGAPEINISIQALLGNEGRTVVTDEAVYIFGYESSDVSGTAVEIFKLVDGMVMHSGYQTIDGVALSGDGISLDGDTILISTLTNSEAGYITTVRAYNSALEIISKVDFPALLTKVQKDGSKIYLNGSDIAYAVDFSDPAAPVLIEADGEADISESLVEFEDGYVIFAQDIDGSLKLSKIIEDVNGELSNCYDIVVYSGEGASSLALTNNELLYVSGNLVGVPYGYFDGYDYCYTYALYRSVGNAFELVGTFEAHETDSSFEMSKAIEDNGILYVFSKGRVYSMLASNEALAVLGRADIIYSSYSGHNAW